jgi:hypothetical protein
MKLKSMFLGFLLFININIVFAQWKTDGVVIVDTLVNTKAEYQIFPKMVNDGDGGAVICWHDNRFGDKYLDIYAQRIDKNGVIKWKKNGIPICSYIYREQFPEICRDNDKNIFISWQDGRDGVYFFPAVQKINSDGQIQWAENGIRLTGQRGLDHRIAADNKGGVYIVYTLPYDVDFKAKVVCQRIGSSGQKVFGDTGIVVCKMLGMIPTTDLAAASDNNGGVVFVWNLNDIIFAQRINADGKKLWGEGGVVLGYSSYSSAHPEIIGNPDGSAFIKWSYTYDNNSVTMNNKFEFINKVSSDGNVQFGFGGVKISDLDEFSFEGVSRLVPDQNNGFYYTHGLFIQRFSPNLIPMWSSNVIPFYNVTSISDAKIINSGEDGIYLIGRSGKKLIAQYLDKFGGKALGNNGLLVVDNSDYGINKVNCISDGSDAAIIAWVDLSNSSIKASKLNKSGIISKVQNPEISIPAHSKLYQNYPNPFNPTTIIKYDLNKSGNVKISLYDVLGREVKVLLNESQSSGSHELNFDANKLASGTYFYKLESGDFNQIKKMMLMK